MSSEIDLQCKRWRVRGVPLVQVADESTTREDDMKTLGLAAAAAAFGLLGAPLAYAVDPPEPRERIEALEIDASGRAGSIRTRPLTLGALGGIYGFGEGACHAHKLAPSTLDALQRALRSGQAIRIHAAPRGDREVESLQCVERVTFFAPDA
jgi:hypothetical protein